MSKSKSKTKTRAYQPALYDSPISLPEARSGGVYVKHDTISGKQPVIGFRQGILRGVRPATVELTTPRLVHELGDDDHGCWMTDRPEELNQIAEMLYHVQPAGSVLVGGLGLGILAKTLLDRPFVSKVIVVERDPDVIKLCAKPGYEVVQADIADYLRTCERADCFLLDTWQGTNEATWWEEVMPQRRIIRQRFGREPVINCWAEDIMHGQILRTLMHAPPHWYYEHLTLPMSERDARAFLCNVGLPAWEKRYGAAVDQAISEQNNKSAVRGVS
jgi:hypothetical protein